MLERLTIGYGAALIITGIVAYVATGAESITALLPSFAGVPILVAGIVAMQTQWNRVALWVAFALVLILGLGSLQGVFGLLGGDVTTASVLNTFIFFVSLAYLVVAFSILRRGEPGSAPVQ